MDSSQRGLHSECRTDIEIMPEACGQPIRIIGMGTGRPLFLPGRNRRRAFRADSHLQGIANAEDEERRALPQDNGLALLRCRSGYMRRSCSACRKVNLSGRLGYFFERNSGKSSCAYSSASTSTFQILLTISFRNSKRRCSGEMTRCQSH